LTLRNALVLLPRVLHVLELDQDLRISYIALFRAFALGLA
jgi:hypothetical protein